MDAENNKINRICNELNYYRYAKLLTEVCTGIMLMVYNNFYDWPDGSLPHELADHIDKILSIPDHQNTKQEIMKDKEHHQKTVKQLLNNQEIKKDKEDHKKIVKQLPNKKEVKKDKEDHQKTMKQLLNKQEIKKLEDMKRDKKKLKGYDISLYFKFIRFTTNNSLLKPHNDDVWNEKCPERRKGELEHLLFLIKDDRNNFNHENNKFLNLKDEYIESFCNILHVRFQSIIKQTGEKLKKNQEDIDKISNMFKDEIESIKVMKEISSSDETPVLKIMLQNDLMPKLQELRRCFSEELKSYCKPKFKIENGTSISAKELLSNFKLICINAEAGYGKTSFTKFVQYELLSEIEKAVDDDLGSRDIPIRIACGKITGRSVSDFLEDEIPFSRHKVSNTSSLKNFLDRFPILWILDGYDNRTAEFTGFFESLLKTLPSIHKIIITLRPNSLKELKVKLKEKEMRQVSIECFDDQQIREVAMKDLGEGKVSDFESAIKTLNDETLKFVKIPINLSLYLELWSSDRIIFDGQLMSIYQLYDKILDKHRNLLVSHLKDKTNDTSDEDLNNGVTFWFSYLCEVVAESAFSYELRISEAQKEKLMEKAKEYGLKGTYCLSTFFNTKESSVETNYFICRDKTQKEVLSCVYLKNCDDDALKAVTQQGGIDDLLNDEYLDGNCFKHIKFLMECNVCKFANIFVPLLAIYSGLQRPDCLLQIKDGKEKYFIDLKNNLKASGQFLVLRVYYDGEVDDLLKVLLYLMPDLYSFKIKIDKDITMYKEINNFISKYKYCNSFDLKLSFVEPNEFVRVIQMMTKEGNQHLIKELNLNYYKMCEWTEEMKKELLKLDSLNFVSFCVDCDNYSSSILHDFTTEEIDSTDVHPTQTLSTTINLRTTSSTSLAALDHSCHLHLLIMYIKDPSKVIEDLVEVNSKFASMTVDLHFSSASCDLPDNLLQRFLSSSVRVKGLTIILDVSSKFPNAMKLLKYGDIETLTLYSFNEDESSSESNFESFIAICDFDKVKEIKLHISAKSPLKLIYNKLSSDLLNKIRLNIVLDESSAEMKIDVESKKFKNIGIWNSKYLSAPEIDQLKTISRYFDNHDEI